MLLLIELGVWAAICLGCVAYDIRWGAFWATVIALGIGALFLGFNVFTFAWANPIIVAKYIAVYAAVGLVWGSFKFWLKLRKARNKYVTDKAAWLEDKDRGKFRDVEIEPRTEADWIHKVKSSSYDKKEYAPTVADNKYDIMFWVWHWPFSVIAFFLEDIIKELWNLTWKMIKGLMEGLRKAALGEAAKDLD